MGDDPLDDLLRDEETEPQPRKRRRPLAPPRPDDQHDTDLGNARRVVARHGSDLHYCFPWKNWLFWDARRWAEDNTGETVRCAKETQGALFREATAELQRQSGTGNEVDRARALATVNHAIRWEHVQRIAASLELAKSEPGVPVLPEDLDRDPLLLNVQNGTLDLRTGKLRSHCRTDLITKLAPVTFDEKATCPLWCQFLQRIMGDNDDLVAYMQRVIGYCLTGLVSEQCLWFFYGTGSNGKSTFLDTILALMGDYGIQSVSELLMVKTHDSHPTERADLFGRRVVATIEVDEGKRIAESLTKQLTGGDRVRARKMHRDFFEFMPTHKLLLAANHKPRIVGTDLAIWRRVKLVPFTVTITEEEKDKALPGKLKQEAAGILNWALAGCLAWQQHGLGEPDEIRQATAAYQAEQDSLGEFLKDCCYLNPEAKCRASLLFEAYCNWSGDKLLSSKAFGQRLRERGYDSKRGHGGNVLWCGLGLLSASEDDG
jgi:putative DNA primase/helicase